MPFPPFHNYAGNVRGDEKTWKMRARKMEGSRKMFLMLRTYRCRVSLNHVMRSRFFKRGSRSLVGQFSRRAHSWRTCQSVQEGKRGGVNHEAVRLRGWVGERECVCVCACVCDE